MPASDYIRETKATCTCDSCMYLKTELGQAMLIWSSAFVRACKEAVKIGAEPGMKMSLNLNGPTAEMIAANDMRGPGDIYSTIAFDIYNVATHAPAILSGPDFDVLIEEYADDPVLLPTLKWLKNRYGP